jgi:hypothetical protein
LGGISVPRGWILAALAVALAIGAFLALRFFLLGQGQGSDLSSAANLTPRNVEGTVGGPGTPEYNELIEALDQNAALEAKAKGESFVATPVGRKPDPKSQPAPKADKGGLTVTMAPQVMAKAPEPPARAPQGASKAAGQVRPDQGLTQAMVADLKGLSRGGPGAFVVSLGPGGDGGSGVAGVQGAKAAGAAVKSAGPSMVPGDVIYAVTELAVNSDVPAPVMARAVGGKLDGAKFLGGFARHGENVTLSFSRVVFPDSRTYAVEALAVDPGTDSASIGGKVDRHWLSRWGGLLASSFLEGFGEALSGRGTRVSVYGDVVSVERGRVDLGEISLEALGQVGSRAATQLEKGFDRPPTVTIPAGSPIGLLILGTKE